MAHERIRFGSVSEQSRVWIARRSGILQRDLDPIIIARIDSQTFAQCSTSHDRRGIECAHGHGFWLFDQVAAQIVLTGGHPPLFRTFPIVRNLLLADRHEGHKKERHHGHHHSGNDRS